MGSGQSYEQQAAVGSRQAGSVVRKVGVQKRRMKKNVVVPSAGLFMPNLTKMDKDRSSSLVADHAAHLEKSGHKAYNHALYWSI